MFRKISHTVLVMIVVMISSFIATTLMGRILPIEEFGEYSLVKSMLTVCPGIAILGLDYSYVRLYPTVHPIGLNKIVVFVTALTSLILTTLISLIYGIAGYQILLMYGALWAGTFSLFLAGYSRKRNRFIIAQLIQGGWKIIFLILVGLATLMTGGISIDAVYPFFAFSFLLLVLFFFQLISDSKRDCCNTVSFGRADLRQFMRFGGAIWLMNGLTLLFGSLDALLIPYFVDRVMLGIYIGISFVFTVSFTMFGSAIGYVLFPAISRGDRIHWKRVMIFCGIGLTAMLAFFLITGESLVNLIFKNKFADYTELSMVVLFCVLGILRFAHTVMHFIIISLGDRKTQTQYITFAVFVNIMFFGMFYMIGYSGDYSLSVIVRIVLIMWGLKSLRSVHLVYRLIRSGRLGYSV